MKNLSYAYTGSKTPLIGKTIPDFLDEIVQKYPDNEALVAPFCGVRYTYREFRDICRQAAKSLMALGVKKGDRVAIWATNYPEWVIVQFATSMIGAILVTVNPAYRTAELEHALKDANVQTLFLIEKFKTSDYVQMFYQVCPRAKVSEPGDIVSMKLPFLRNVVLISNSNRRYDGMFNWKEFMSLNKFTKLRKDISDEQLIERQASLDPDDIINVQYTSGTTGFPKGASLTHHNILNNGFFIGETMKFTDKDRLCIPVPFYHCFGMVLGNLACITHGATMVLPAEYFDPLATLETVEVEKCTALHGVPIMFHAELRHPEFKSFDLRSLRTGIMAGESCPVEGMKEVNNLMYMKEVTIAYGLTEASPVITQTPANASLNIRTSTVGLPLPHTEVKIIDSETGKTVPCGKDGELCVRGYQVMRGYHNNPEATKKTIDKAGWLHSGDLATMDKNGYCNIIGRVEEDMFCRGGENVYTKEVEEFLRKHPKINDVRITWVPDKRLGKEGYAAIQLKKGESATAEDMRDFCREKIAHYKIPKYFKFVDSFPMTVTGKVQKKKIREKAIKELGLEEVAKIKVA